MSTLEQQYVAESLQSIAKLHGSRSSSKSLQGNSTGVTAIMKKKPKVCTSSLSIAVNSSHNTGGDNSSRNHKW